MKKKKPSREKYTQIKKTMVNQNVETKWLNQKLRSLHEEQEQIILGRNEYIPKAMKLRTQESQIYILHLI